MNASTPPSTSLRRAPVQRRSRERFARVLQAAGAILAGEGYEAFTIRAVSERSGVSVPAIYQWFADKDEIAGALLEHHMAELDELVAEELAAYDGRSIRGLVERVIGAHVAFYRAHPSHVVLWFQGRVAPPVVEWVHHHSEQLAATFHGFAVEHGILPPTTPQVAFHMIVEVVDRVHELAFRLDERGDDAVIAHGVDLVDAYLARLREPSGPGVRTRR